MQHITKTKLLTRTISAFIGVGGFFKAHKDTPRSEDFFGSLIIALPTAHEGGELVLRRKNESWKVDFGSLTADAAGNPRIGFVAFYSDVEHEVLPVTSGCRTTLTYNLKWVTSPGRLPSSIQTISDKRLQIVQSLATMLADSEYLPNGGVLGFHLHHQYPFSTSNALKGQIKDVIPWLKGSDRVFYDVCKELSLDIEAKFLFHADTYTLFLCDRVVNLQNLGQGVESSDQIIDILNDEGNGGTLILNEDRFRILGASVEYRAKGAGLGVMEPVDWINRHDAENLIKEQCVAYGNEVETAYAYYKACFILKLGRPGSREWYEAPPDETQEEIAARRYR